jgi:Domain of unknown function (DUF4410)
MKTHSRSDKIRAQDRLALAIRGQSLDAPATLARKLAAIVSCVFAMLMVAGCASTKVTNQQQLVTGLLPRPAHIWVYDFVATASDVPSDSKLAGEDDVDTTAPQTAEQIAEGKQLGAEVAAQLVEQIHNMGLPAAHGGPGTTPQTNDLVIRGYLLSIKEGSAAKRVIVGFGAGASELRTMVEGFQMTAQGLRELGSGAVDSGGSKTPGAALGVVGFLATKNPAGLIVSSGMKVYGEASGKSTVKGRAQATAKEIADVLKTRFEEQGWID